MGTVSHNSSSDEPTRLDNGVVVDIVVVLVVVDVVVVVVVVVEVVVVVAILEVDSIVVVEEIVLDLVFDFNVVTVDSLFDLVDVILIDSVEKYDTFSVTVGKDSSVLISLRSPSLCTIFE